VTERRIKLLITAAVWISFLLVSFVASPIPGINEPHYLSKARHEWDGSWCAGDLFLESYSAHRVFYLAVGWWTLHFELATVAAVGRLIALGLLAFGWTALVSRLQQRVGGDASSGRFGSLRVVASACLFLGLQAVGNLSGEWLVGGFESKVFGYAFVFWSIAAFLESRLLVTAACCGVAISFHPIVGLWNLVAMAAATALEPNVRAVIWKQLAARRSRSLLAAGLLVVSALPGIWPAVSMLSGVDRRTTALANYIQVFYRLKHHLDPMDFGRWNVASYTLLGAAWFIVIVKLVRSSPSESPLRWWMRYVLATALIAVIGFAIGCGTRPATLTPQYEWRAALLKFYPFRMFDLFLPIAVAVIVPQLIKQRVMWFIAAMSLIWALLAGHVFPAANRLSESKRADWRDVCHWIAANAPADAVFLTPLEAEAFKWFAQRAEYVNFKDCPQDAANIVEWNRRLRTIANWSATSFADETYSAEDIQQLVRLTGVRFAITPSRVVYSADLLYQNGSYKIFRLADLD
jgi:hypothetical protein